MAVSATTLAVRQARYDRRITSALSKIPEGPYCYDQNGRCPFWKSRRDKPHQSNGFCRLLKKGDWMSIEKGGTMLLWDQVKECGLKLGEESE